MMRSPAPWLAVVATVSCGAAHAPERTAADVERAETLPAGYVALGTAHARCAGPPAWGQLDSEPLTRFECGNATLERALAEQAAARGGSLLAGMRCRGTRASLACSATIAAPQAGTTPLGTRARAATARRDALSYETARRIEVDFEPAVLRFGRRARAADEVSVQLSVPVSHLPVGSLSVRCEKNDCNSDDLRVALRVAAGALGVSDVAEVACGVRHEDAFCVATLAASELDPETEPRAR